MCTSEIIFCSLLTNAEVEVLDGSICAWLKEMLELELESKDRSYKEARKSAAERQV